MKPSTPGEEKATVPALLKVPSVESPRTFHVLVPSSARLLTRPVPLSLMAPDSVLPLLRRMSSVPLAAMTWPFSAEALALRSTCPVSTIVTTPPLVTLAGRMCSSTPSSALPPWRAMMSASSSITR